MQAAVIVSSMLAHESCKADRQFFPVCRMAYSVASIRVKPQYSAHAHDRLRVKFSLSAAENAAPL
jgi:hypothetical protein